MLQQTVGHTLTQLVSGVCTKCPHMHCTEAASDENSIKKHSIQSVCVVCTLKLLISLVAHRQRRAQRFPKKNYKHRGLKSVVDKRQKKRKNGQPVHRASEPEICRIIIVLMTWNGSSSFCILFLCFTRSKTLFFSFFSSDFSSSLYRSPPR